MGEDDRTGSRGDRENMEEGAFEYHGTSFTYVIKLSRSAEPKPTLRETLKAPPLPKRTF